MKKRSLRSLREERKALSFFYNSMSNNLVNKDAIPYWRNIKAKIEKIEAELQRREK